MIDYCEALGQLYNNWKVARASGAIAPDSLYRPAVEKPMARVRILCCKDADGNKIDAVATVRLELSLVEQVRSNEDRGIDDQIAEQRKDVERVLKEEAAEKAKAAALAAEPPYTTLEKIMDFSGGLLLGAIVWMICGMEWRLLGKQDWALLAATFVVAALIVRYGEAVIATVESWVKSAWRALFPKTE